MHLSEMDYRQLGRASADICTLFERLMVEHPEQVEAQSLLVDLLGQIANEVGMRLVGGDAALLRRIMPRPDQH